MWAPCFEALESPSSTDNRTNDDSGSQNGAQMGPQNGAQKSFGQMSPTKTWTCEFQTLFTMFQPCQAVQKKRLFGSVLGTWFGVKCRSWKSPFENTSLQAPIPTWKPPVWFLGSEWGPHLELKSFKMEAWNTHVNLWDPTVVPRWPQAPKLTQNGSQTHSKCVPKSMLLG